MYELLEYNEYVEFATTDQQALINESIAMKCKFTIFCYEHGIEEAEELAEYDFSDVIDCCKFHLADDYEMLGENLMKEGFFGEVPSQAIQEHIDFEALGESSDFEMVEIAMMHITVVCFYIMK